MIVPCTESEKQSDWNVSFWYLFYFFLVFIFLQKVTHSEEKCYGTDIIGGLVFSVLTLDFDYVKKDRRQRKYALEDEKDVKVTYFKSFTTGWANA